MENSRQRIFQRLRPSCVDLSTIGLRFKGNQATVKDVLRVLETQHQVLDELGLANELDHKLAEYAFFPLTPIFNESQRLSPRCLEIAVQSVTVLVRKGWRHSLAPEMGRQLLLLMSFVAGGDPRHRVHPPTDELKAAAFQCIAAVVQCLFSAAQVASVLQNETTKSIVDQLTYLLTESISESTADFVQIAASEALYALYQTIPDRVLLASLLPRTVSSLTKALKTSTQARRTQKVHVTNLRLLSLALRQVLSGDVVADAKLAGHGQEEALSEFWLQATSSQVRTALQQVVNLRSSKQDQVRFALAELCTSLIEECSISLSDAISILLETLIVLSGSNGDEKTLSMLRHLMFAQPTLIDVLRSRFFDWMQSLPRIMQGHEDRPKELMLSRITTSFDLIGETSGKTDNIVAELTSVLLKCVTNTMSADGARAIQFPNTGTRDDMTVFKASEQPAVQPFGPILFDNQSQQASLQELQRLINHLKQDSGFGTIGRYVVNTAAHTNGGEKTASVWLAVQLLTKSDSAIFDFEDLVLTDATDSSLRNARSYLINDLYSLTKEHLLASDADANGELDWRLTALSMQTLVLQAQQLRKDYRNELYETLYPVLALFNSSNLIVRGHAVTTLNLLASACEYPSARTMLMENIDYVVNSIAWRLNTFDLSLEAPRVLNMAVQLIGASLIPYLDDLISSIFVALDNYHGYTAWVETLFTVLRTIVDESVKQPQLALTDGRSQSPRHQKQSRKPTTLDDILGRVRARRRRRLKHESLSLLSEKDDERAPRRPWTRAEDDPSHKPSTVADEDDVSLESILKQDEEAPLPPPSSSNDKEKEEDLTKPLTTSHDLLLEIARATVPHLSSPSPRVRHLLLQLLCQISPLLSRHENTFLPLINAIWPAVISRLFAEQAPSISHSNTSSLLFGDQHQQNQTSEYGDSTIDAAREMPYTIAEAARLVSILSANAGDFMSSRVEKIFPPLVKLFEDTRQVIEQKNRRRAAAATTTEITTQTPLGVIISGSSPAQAQPQSQAMHNDPLTSVLQTNLITLLTTILTHTTLNLSTSDHIFTLLVPFVTDTQGTDTKMQTQTPLGQEIQHALKQYNPDALWVVQQRRKIEREIERGVRGSVWDRAWRGGGSELGADNGTDVGISVGISGSGGIEQGRELKFEQICF